MVGWLPSVLNLLNMGAGTPVPPPPPPVTPGEVNSALTVTGRITSSLTVGEKL